MTKLFILEEKSQFGQKQLSALQMMHYICGRFLQFSTNNGATARVILFDFKKAFHLVGHHILVQKLRSYNFHKQLVLWIVDFLIGRMKRVKIGQDFYLEWASVPAGVTVKAPKRDLGCSS